MNIVSSLNRNCLRSDSYVVYMERLQNEWNVFIYVLQHEKRTSSAGDRIPRRIPGGLTRPRYVLEERASGMHDSMSCAHSFVSNATGLRFGRLPCWASIARGIRFQFSTTTSGYIWFKHVQLVENLTVSVSMHVRLAGCHYALLPSVIGTTAKNICKKWVQNWHWRLFWGGGCI